MPKGKKRGTHSDMPKGKKRGTHSDMPKGKNLRGTHSNIPHGLVPLAGEFNSNVLESRKPILNNVIKALTDPNTHSIGVYGEYVEEVKHTLLDRVKRRNERDKLFDLVLTANVTKKPDVKKIQDELARQLRLTFNKKSIARQLCLTFNKKSKDKRAQELIERIKIQRRILIVLCDLHQALDLGKVGIPSGTDHPGCKILLTSTTGDVLSNRMHTQKNFKV